MELDFNKMDGLIPAIIQDASTKNVLMLGFMNKEAFDKTVETKKVTFYSRTKQRLWTKGESSGNFINVVSIDEAIELGIQTTVIDNDWRSMFLDQMSDAEAGRLFKAIMDIRC